MDTAFSHMEGTISMAIFMSRFFNVTSDKISISGNTVPAISLGHCDLRNVSGATVMTNFEDGSEGAEFEFLRPGSRFLLFRRLCMFIV
jgi:hypothetical protein